MKQITLKEASAISGYSADYIGQLIRAGKLEGQQVFSNVSWVTTEEAVRAYVEKSKKGQVEAPPFIERMKERISSSEGLTLVFTIVSYTAIAILGLFIVLLISIISITIDHRVERAYVESIQHVQ